MSLTDGKYTTYNSIFIYYTEYWEEITFQCYHEDGIYSFP